MSRVQKEISMGHYWSSKKPAPLVRQRREQLDKLLCFANAGQTLGADDADERHISDFLEMINAMCLHRPSECIHALDGGLIRSVQGHVQGRLDKIIHNSEMLWKMPLWEVKGVLEFAVDPLSGRFQERFRPHLAKKTSERKMIMMTVDLLFIEIIRDLDLKPTRFRRCPRCGTYFCQPTEREKLYCSTRCSDAVRIERFRKDNKMAKRKARESE
jgi:hypothetical protein